MIDDAGDSSPKVAHQTIRKRAMDLLARREHAPAELAAKLRKRDYPDADISAVLEQLTDDNLLSASRYAHAVVAARAARGVGPVRIRAELSTAGIDDALAEQAIAATDSDWHAQAEAARRKRFGTQKPADFPARAKQMRFLQRRGYDFDVIDAVVGAD